MGDAAAAAGVSKALVHYHFHDKETLLVALVDTVGADVTARERAAMGTSAASGNALDAYWGWLAPELAHGDMRILVALGECDNERVRAASRNVAAERRRLAEEHVSLVFERLALSPRVPDRVIAETVVAFVDGLACAHALDPSRDPRPAFDVLWLGFLGLAE